MDDFCLFIEIACQHPIVAGFFGIFLAAAVTLGVLHECRVFGDCALVLLRHLKQECDDSRATWHRLQDEVRSWKK